MSSVIYFNNSICSIAESVLDDITVPDEQNMPLVIFKIFGELNQRPYLPNDVLPDILRQFYRGQVLERALAQLPYYFLVFQAQKRAKKATENIPSALQVFKIFMLLFKKIVRVELG